MKHGALHICHNLYSVSLPTDKPLGLEFLFELEFCGERKTGEPIANSTDINDTGSGNRTQDTLEGSECSHQCAIPTPLWSVMLNYLALRLHCKSIMLQYLAICMHWRSVMLDYLALCMHYKSIMFDYLAICMHCKSIMLDYLATHMHCRSIMLHYLALCIHDIASL